MESESKDLVNKICEEVQAEIEAEKTGSSKPGL